MPNDIPNLTHRAPREVRRCGERASRQPFKKKRLPNCREALGVAPLVHTRARFLNQDSDTRYAGGVEGDHAEDKTLRPISRCCRRRIETALRLRPGTSAKVEIIESDILAVRPGTIGRRAGTGLRIFAAISKRLRVLAHIHKYRMWWLGHDALRVRNREIG